MQSGVTCGVAAARNQPVRSVKKFARPIASWLSEQLGWSQSKTVWCWASRKWMGQPRNSSGRAFIVAALATHHPVKPATPHPTALPYGGGTAKCHGRKYTLKLIGVIEKTLSTPHDLSEAVIGRLRRLGLKAGIPLSEVDHLVHGTSVPTYTALTHRGVEVGMIITEGFRGILYIARHKNPQRLTATGLALANPTAGQAPAPSRPPPTRR